MLESVKQLEQMGFQLFASLGTADFYSDNGVKVLHAKLSLRYNYLCLCF